MGLQRGQPSGGGVCAQVATEPGSSFGGPCWASHSSPGPVTSQSGCVDQNGRDRGHSSSSSLRSLQEGQRKPSMKSTWSPQRVTRNSHGSCRILLCTSWGGCVCGRRHSGEVAAPAQSLVPTLDMHGVGQLPEESPLPVGVSLRLGKGKGRSTELYLSSSSSHHHHIPRPSSGWRCSDV